MIDESTRAKMQEWLTAREAEIKKYRLEQALEKIYFPRKPNHAVPPGAVLELYDFAVETIGDGPILYLEFGVFNGRSMSRMADRFPHADARFFGFDSFEGLPANWKNMPEGTFSTRGKIPIVADSRASFVKGLRVLVYF